MLSRVTGDSARHGYRTYRGFLDNGYSKTLCLGAMLDQSVRDGKVIYAVVEPLLRQCADTGRANRARTQGLSQYEGFRDKAMDLDHCVQGAGPQLKHIGY